MNVSNGRGRILAIAVGIVWSGLLSGGAPGGREIVYKLHIESQPLEDALNEFAQQTGMQIIFFSRLTEGRRSSALDGAYTIDTAMTALLSGSKLTYRMVNSKTIEIVRKGGRN